MQDYRFYCDRTKYKNLNQNNLTNHVFVVPDMRLLQAIRDQGYCHCLEQYKMSHYSKPSVRSFLKYITTHKVSYLHTKTLDWAISSYINSIASKVVIALKVTQKRSYRKCNTNRARFQSTVKGRWKRVADF